MKKKNKDDEDHKKRSPPMVPAPVSESPRDRMKKYLKLVKDTLQDRMEKYYEFLNVTKDIFLERHSVSYVTGKIKELFKEYPQLILEYNSFVQKEFKIPLPPEDAPKLAKQLNLNNGDTFSRKVQETRDKRDHRNKNLQQKRKHVPMKQCAVQQFYQGADGIENSGTTKSRQEVVGQNIPLYSRDEKLKKSIKELDLSKCKSCTPSYRILPENYMLPSVSQRTSIDAEVLNDHCVLVTSRTEGLKKSIKKLDLSNCKSCTPSYRILPENYMLPSVSQRTSIDAEVLNDHCVLVTSRTEDFKHVQKNQYENTIFLCEDDRFELDMWLELLHSTIARIQELICKISNNDINIDHPFRIEDYLTARHLKCIERLYDDYWIDVIKRTRRNAPLSLSVILSRLKQKLVEWKQSQSACNKVWAETVVKNLDKSLDHCSYDFKQQDSKSWSTSALVSEIKEITNDAAVESIVARSRQPIVPHMEFEFPDPEIHEDLYWLIKYSCGNICPMEHTDDLMKIWTTFLDPVLGVPHRPHSGGHIGNRTFSYVGEKDSTSGGSAITNRKQSDVSGNGDDFTLQLLATSQVCLDDGITVDNGDPPCSIDHMGDVSTKAIPSSKQILPQGTGSLHRGEKSMTHLEVERKEGVLSPYRDDELKKFAVCRGGSIASQSVDRLGSELEDFSSEEPDGEGDGGQMPALPLNELVPLALREEDKSGLTFYGNDSFYVLFRLHQTLYERIRKAKLHCSSAENRLRGSNDTKPTESYKRLLSAIKRFCGGSSNIAEFQDDCRSLIGTHSNYYLCILDILVYKIVQQLQKIATDEADMRFIELHAYAE